MNFKLEILGKNDLKQFKKDMQEAFQKGFIGDGGDGMFTFQKVIKWFLNSYFEHLIYFTSADLFRM